MIATTSAETAVLQSNAHAIAMSYAAAAPLDGLSGTVLRVARNREIYSQGSSVDHFYKVVSGTVRTCKIMADGRRQIGEFTLPGEFFGLDGVSEHRLSAEAVADAVIVRYPRHAAMMSPEHAAAIQAHVHALTMASYERTQDLVVLLGRKTAQERVASFLIELAERSGSEALIELPMSRYDIADHLGLTVETVSRTFGQLKGEGAIALDSAQRVRIVDYDLLAELGSADAL